MFDLPMHDKPMRKAYALFRKRLMRDGFTKMQFSVYIRNCSSRENAEVHLRRVEEAVPEDGEVRVLTVTDKQFERMRVFWGKNHVAAEDAPAQLELF